jgi:hypothetical protein
MTQSIDGDSEDAPDKAFAELFKLFSKPTKSPAKAYRTYELTFENGEPVFTLSEADRILEAAFGKNTPSVVRKEPAAISVKTAKQFRSLA